MYTASASRVVASCILLGALTCPARAEAPPDEEQIVLPDEPQPLTAASAEADAMPSSLPEDNPTPARSYERPPLRFEGNFLGALALRFADEGGPMSYGFGITYGIGWGEIPLLLGLDYVTANASNVSASVALSVPDHESLEAGRKATDRTHYFDVWMRVQPPHWSVRPYLEGFIGTKLVQSRYTLELAADGGVATEAVTDHAWASSYGWGAGVDFWGLFKAAGSISLTIGVRQLYGGKVSFERSLAIDGQDRAARYTLGTTVFLVTAGIVGCFDMSAEPDPYADNAL